MDQSSNSNPGRRRAIRIAAAHALLPLASTSELAQALTLDGGLAAAASDAAGPDGAIGGQPGHAVMSRVRVSDPRRFEEPPFRPVTPGNHGEASTDRRPSPQSTVAVENSGAIDAMGEYRAVSPGSWMGFCVSDNVATAGQVRRATYTVERLAPSPQVVRRGTVPVRRQFVGRDQPWVNGTDWDTTLGLEIPYDWKAGIYRTTFTSAEGATSAVPFLVRSLRPGSVSRIVVEVPFDTMQAYNAWGGKSLYDYNSSDGQRASRVSTRRPLAPGALNDVEHWVVPFTLWAEKAGFALEFMSGGDLAVNPWLIDNYNACVLVGHDEYWTEAMRSTLERFTARGGNLAVFGGNTMWWRTEHRPDRSGHATGILVCEKAEGTSTDLWYRFRSEAALIGDTFLTGGWIADTQVELSRGDYTVYRPDHWVFAGTGFTRGSKFGSAYRIMRYEVDGVYYNLDADGTPVSTGSYGVPDNIEILAHHILPDGWVVNGDKPNAAFVSFRMKSGATIVNVGTTDWVRALEPFVTDGTWTPECQITRNILARLRTGTRR